MNPNEDPVIAALRASLEQNPRNPDVWIHLAGLLEAGGRLDEAVDALRNALQTGADQVETTARLVPLLRNTGALSEALIRTEQVLESQGHRGLEEELYQIHRARGDQEAADELATRLKAQYPDFTPGAPATPATPVTPAPPPPTAPVTPSEPPAPVVPPESPMGGAPEEPDPDRLAEVQPEETDVEEWASQFDWGDLHVTFDDVAGLTDVKRQIRLRIIAPQKNREVYQAFQRQAGGGILLYGPPGCGKTFIAKATAGESGARFVSVGIHEIVDKYWGETEKLVHQLFEEARRKTPTVLFFDEFDALGGARGSTGSQFWRVMVDQLLQEMDGLSGNNENLLVFAATNVPWNIDPAFRRPGRFDRLFFVPPPDTAGRTQILEHHASKLPGGEKIPVKKIVKQTSLWTGADLKALCERASEESLERSLESGEIVPVTLDHFQREIARMDSSAQEWLSTAKNYARFANEGGQYDDLQRFLRKIKRW